ncbi:uncharacterized protein FIBRA_03093 [Fibroporia radiculosa]|uniref:Uncharacterized protein n=1 Tax=Fibroporia radiculosa TaxID=599839 RepID=J4GNA4_9APHY|nr:uncharacterized protein FIBRA_03093 [Fibroporia radiculosa]CCM01045.1 predicted protein [Fibroporia radiculosa]
MISLQPPVDLCEPILQFLSPSAGYMRLSTVFVLASALLVAPAVQAIVLSEAEIRLNYPPQINKPLPPRPGHPRPRSYRREELAARRDYDIVHYEQGGRHDGYEHFHEHEFDGRGRHERDEETDRRYMRRMVARALLEELD